MHAFGVSEPWQDFQDEHEAKSMEWERFLLSIWSPLLQDVRLVVPLGAISALGR